jgi:hypothetical protein
MNGKFDSMPMKAAMKSDCREAPAKPVARPRRMRTVSIDRPEYGTDDNGGPVFVC